MVDPSSITYKCFKSLRDGHVSAVIFLRCNIDNAEETMKIIIGR